MIDPAVIRRTVTIVSRALAVAGLGLLLLLATCTMLDGILRSVAGRPIDLVREVSDLVAAIAVSCCLPVSLLYRSNIALRTLKGLRSAMVTRVVDVGADTLVLVVVGAIAWQFFVFAQKTAQAGDVTWLMNLPKAPFWFAVSGVLAFAALVQAFVLSETIAGRLHKNRLEGTA